MSFKKYKKNGKKTLQLLLTAILVSSSLTVINTIKVHASNIVNDYLYTGNTQTFTAPYTGKYQLECWGAEGGVWGGVTPGKGGYSKGNVQLNAGQSIYIYVGGSGTSGGYNGGGYAPISPTGGGATDVRTITDGIWSNNLNSRIIVAGGGGSSEWYGGVGGDGGGLTGETGSIGNIGNPTTYAPGQGGTQTSGGYGEYKNGAFGIGGYGTTGDGGGSGGGGWYGGGTPNIASGGGGGSSYIGGVINGTTTKGINIGNGKAIITYDNTAPSLTLIANITSPTNGDIVITATASDDLVGVQSIKLPNNNIVASNSVAYTVSANGTYTFITYDKNNNATTKSITVSNIDKTAPSYNSIDIKNVTETGFDIVVDVTDEGSGVDKISLPIWRSGNYSGMVWTHYYNQGNGIHTYHIDMSSIGAGTDYIYTSKQLTDNAGNHFYGGDIAFKLDTTPPVATVTQPSTAWTKDTTTIRSIMSDNFNGVEKVSITNPDSTKTTRNTFSKPKILSLIGTSGVGASLSYLQSQGYDITIKNNITNVSELAGYNIILCDDSAWSVEFGSILNQGYDLGYRILTYGNDTGASAGIHPVISAIGGSGTYTLNQYTNNAGLGAEYQQGDSDNVMKYFDGIPNGDSLNLVTAYPSDTRVIATNSMDNSPAVLYSINNNGGKWIHVQDWTSHGIFSKRLVDELLLGTMANRMSYSEYFTVSQNGTYSIVAEDFYGNITTKNINVSNIDTTAPTVTLSQNPAILTNGNVIITVNATDSQSGIKYIKKHDGTVVNGVASTTFTATVNGNYNFEVSDNVGNVTTKTIVITNIDKVVPTMSLSQSPTIWTREDVLISVTPTDIHSGIKQIKLPNGNYINESSASYSVGANGEYEFIAEDYAGNIYAKKIVVTNIDKTVPVATHTRSLLQWVESSDTLKVTGTDTQSSMKRIKLPSGSYVNGSTASYPITTNGNYAFVLEDNAGNQLTYVVTVSNIVYKPTLTVTPVPSEDYINLEWSMPDSSQPYNYKAYKKAEDASEYQSISATSVNNKIKVLNIYPELSSGTPIAVETFTTADGKTYTLPKSALTKMWMETPNPENVYGYGMGLITVDAVSVTDFNANPNLYLYDENGKYKYNVLYQGMWDSYGYMSLSSNSNTEIRKFVATGRGFLQGHDTSTVNDILFNGGTNGAPVSSTKVKVVKKGLLTNYPWNIGEIDTVLNTPYSHNGGRYTSGDVWLKYDDYTNPNYGLSAPWRGPEINDGNGSTNYYLVSKNNVAMIQTGHSNGQATSDEQKLLANTLLYLSQITSDTSLDDHSGQDVKAPTKPNIISAKLDGNLNKVNIAFGASQDQGSSYDYYIEASGQNNGAKTNSLIKSAVITSGLSGYSITLDTNPNTVPNNVVNTTSLNLSLTKPTGTEIYFHVRAIDKVGNASETVHFKVEDFTPPVLTLTLQPNNWTKGTINIVATATDNDSGVREIKLPNGNIISGNSATYTVAQNGVYYFEATDFMGNKHVKYIVVDKIDKNIPTIDIQNNQNWNNSSGVPVTIIGEDN